MSATRRKRCYLCGAMRGRGEEACRLYFKRHEHELRRAGWDVVNPADFGFAHPETREEYLRIIERDLALVLSLDPRYRDAVVVLPGYELSEGGATAEVAVARWAQVRRLTYEEALLDRDGEEMV